jgi:hypothetical protein
LPGAAEETISTSVAVLTLLTVSPVVRGGSNRAPDVPLFHTSDRCVACHNGMKTPAGEDFSIGLECRCGRAVQPTPRAADRRGSGR